MKREELLKKWSTPQKVGPHGFVRLVDVMGDDAAIVQAARQSYGDGTKTVREDKKLINYLTRFKHTTPLEMASIKLHIKVPMAIWRQWVRHRTASINEYSTRYSTAIKEIAETDQESWRLQSTSNKQGSEGYLHELDLVTTGSGEFISGEEAARRLCDQEKEAYDMLRTCYNERLEMGIAREQARDILPLSNYTEAYWKINLHNLFHFLRLRIHPHAQLEIREYAQAIANILEDWVPHAYYAFEEYIVGAQTFSRKEVQWIQQELKGRLEELRENPEERLLSLSSTGIDNKRERLELWSKVYKKE